MERPDTDAPEAAKLLNVPNSKEFKKFYDMRPELNEREKFVRALAYGRYEKKIYIDAEKFMPIDFCITKALELQDMKLVQYFIAQVKPKDMVTDSLVQLAKKGKSYSEFFIKLLNAASIGIHEDPPEFLLYIGDFSDDTIKEVEKIFIRDSQDSFFDTPTLQNYIYFAKVITGKEKLTPERVARYMQFEGSSLRDILPTIFDMNMYDLADQLLEMAKSIGIIKHLPLMVLNSNIQRKKIKSLKSLLPEITDDMASELGTVVGKTGDVEIYSMILQKFSDPKIMITFRWNVFMTTKSTSPLYKILFTIVQEKEWKFPFMEYVYFNHRDDPLAVAIYFGKKLNSDPIEMVGHFNFGDTEVAYLVKLFAELFPNIPVDITKIFGY